MIARLRHSAAPIGRRLVRSSEPRRSGVTLVEMLIAVTLTLLIMFAVVRVFQLMGDSLSVGRATIEMAGQIRSAADRLQRDLDGLTAQTLPWVDSAAAQGYFEYVEGVGSDWDSDFDGIDDQIDSFERGKGVYGNPRDTSLGDIDDVLMFTARSMGAPFVGRFQGLNNVPVLIESQDAEIIWWVEYQETNDVEGRQPEEPFVLRRRVLLVRPDLDLRNLQVTNEVQRIDFFNRNDISARVLASGGTGLIANSLADLSQRENRFAHRTSNGSLFPFPLNRAMLVPKFDEFLGEDVVLSDVLAFDVRAFDPQAPIDVSNSSVALEPGDSGYYYGNVVSSPARGTYVDLHYARNDNSSVLMGGHFSGPPAVPPSGRPIDRLFFVQLDPTGSQRREAFTYDTWPLFYEHNGIDEDGRFGPDQGTNGLDDDNQNGVDDSGERETVSPYPVPLRGIEVTLRMMDFDTRQVRQVSVIGDFVRE